MIDVITMNDGLLYRSLPAFTGLLVFMPACSDDEPAATATGADDDSSSGEPSTSPSTTEEPESTGEPSDSSTTDPDPSSSDTGEPATCSEDALCGAPTPEGWFGPFILARAATEAELPDCPEEFPTLGPIAHDGFVDPGSAECSCECEPPAAASCYASVVSSDNENCYGGYYYYYGYMDYGYGGGTMYTQVTEACTNVEIDGFARFRVYGGGYYGGGTDCTPNETKSIPPLAWESSIKACGLPETPLSCSDGGLCIPQPPEGFEDTWCLYQQGDSGCPAGVFNTKVKFYMGAEDDRDCSDCNCGSTASSCSEGELMMFEGPDCAGEPSSILPGGNSCEPAVAASVAVDYGVSAGTCPVTTQPHGTGSATPTGEMTFCCMG
ncbi:MAG: hypothetical protein IAG13_30775 [Deltaproteobacteria bacterium]|nr:hypothetical protein [Nannocystaceae bacterium]